MAFNFINGWNCPRFKVYNSSNELIATIDLPIVNRSGLIESTQELKIIHELLSYEYLQEVKGYRISWTMPYDEYLTGETMLKIQELLRHQKAGHKILLIPRSDFVRRKFEVIYTGDSIEFGLHGGKSMSAGHKHVVLQWSTKQLVDDTGWIDPNSIIYAGFYLYNRFAVLAT